MSERSERAVLVLADGTCYWGRPWGARGKVFGEAVFCTAMSGYQEILTDPSYCRQIVTMTAPQIGNVGVCAADAESRRAWAAGLVVKDASPIESNYRAERPLARYLEAEGVIGISGVDTRALTRRLRDQGSQMAVLASGEDLDPVALAEEARRAAPIEEEDLVRAVTCPEGYEWREGTLSLDGPKEVPPAERLVVVYDFGVKRQTLRLLRDRGCRVKVVPATTRAAEVLAERPAGVLLSNGPGDPARCTYAIEAVRSLLGKVPVFGICLGHQILSLAAGASTRKMKFGHRGSNQPVSSGGKVVITSQNHGFEVSPEGLPEGVLVEERNLSDGSVEGIVMPRARAFSVQYHPEGSPGPHDAEPLFDRFLALCAERIDAPPLS
jgi:carbamoyl-phosphate synthase small subunit